MPGKGTGMWGLPAVELPLSLQLRRPEGPGPEGRSDGPLLWCCRADWQVGAARTTPEGHTPHDSRAVSFCLTFQRACWRPGQASRQVTGLAAALTSRPRAPASLRPHGLFPRVNGRAEGGGPSASLLLLPAWLFPRPGLHTCSQLGARLPRERADGAGRECRMAGLGPSVKN